MGHLFVVCAVGIKMTNETGVALMCSTLLDLLKVNS